MQAKTPWTFSRVFSLVMMVVSGFILLTCVYCFYTAAVLQHGAATDTSGLDSLMAFIFEVFGTGLLILGGVLGALFTWLYRRTTRRLREPPTAVPTPSPVPVAPVAPSVKPDTSELFDEN